ncbi:MAG: DUF692 domain-containing protein [Spongiibacteraceae bacterium]|nr:DUF692 domain-containing protein [Spongiibacteraceae bacterium]
MNKHFLGFGLGVRTDHFQELLDRENCVDWLEIISENFMVAGGKPKYYLHALRERYPMVMHGVSLSLGSAEPLNIAYLNQLKSLVNEVNPIWFSDHLCWTRTNSINSHDLLPLPYNSHVIKMVGDKIKQVQETIGKPFLIENVSSYLSFKESTFSEWEFINEIVHYADCGILLDINNIYVSARNHGFSAIDYIQGINKSRVYQFHLAGHSDYGDYVIDTHDHPIANSVWELYGKALEHFGAISTMIERDDNIPQLQELLDELSVAKKIANKTLAYSSHKQKPESMLSL